MDSGSIRRFMSMVHKAFPTDNRNLKNSTPSQQNKFYTGKQITLRIFSFVITVPLVYSGRTRLEIQCGLLSMGIMSEAQIPTWPLPAS